MFGSIGKMALSFASKVVVKKVIKGFKKMSKHGTELDENMVIDCINKHIDLPVLNEAEEAEFMQYSFKIAKLWYKASKR